MTTNAAAPVAAAAARWPWQRSLQTRILLTYGAIFVGVLVLLLLVIGRFVYQAQADGAERTLEIEAFLAANALQDPLSGYSAEFEAFARRESEHESRLPGPSATALPYDDEGRSLQPTRTVPAALASEQVAGRLQQVATGYAANTGARVTILDSRGNPIADSAYALAQLSSQWGQPEVQAALRGQAQQDIRLDPLSGVTTLYVATPIRQGERILGLVQFGRPMQAVTALAWALLLRLAAVGLLALLIATALALGFTRRLVRPVALLEGAALAVADGDLEQRVPVTTADELGALARAFNVMVASVRDILKQQQLFVANASHELRTPITNIKLRSEALLDAPQMDLSTARRYVAEIDREADRLGRLTGVLLDLSSLTDGALRVPAELTDITPAVHAVVEVMQLRARQAGLTVTADVPEQLPRLRVWPEQLEAILYNLLDNAVKYTPAPGEIRLAAYAEDERCRLRVADTGQGIAPEDLPHIFERFYRADKARSRSVPGLGVGSGAGLGLSIVEALVAQNGGRIRVESVVGHGTAFEIEFPLPRG